MVNYNQFKSCDIYGELLIQDPAPGLYDGQTGAYFRCEGAAAITGNVLLGSTGTNTNIDCSNIYLGNTSVYNTNRINTKSKSVAIDASNSVLVSTGTSTLFITPTSAALSNNTQTSVLGATLNLGYGTPFASTINIGTTTTTVNIPGTIYGTFSSAITGRTGWTGQKGDTGIQGTTGYTGVQGIQGIQGLTGYTGWTGVQGIQGIQGIQGTTGYTGWTGVQGTQGLIGDTGYTGQQGIQGIPGPTGNFDSSAVLNKLTNQSYNSGTNLTTIKGDLDFGSFYPTITNTNIYSYTRFTYLPQCNSVVINNDDLINKLYCDTQIAAVSLLTGATGQQGIQGDIGTTGWTGWTGKNGNTGLTGWTGVVGATGQKGDTGAFPNPYTGDLTIHGNLTASASSVKYTNYNFQTVNSSTDNGITLDITAGNNVWVSNSTTFGFELPGTANDGDYIYIRKLQSPPNTFAITISWPSSVNGYSLTNTGIGSYTMGLTDYEAKFLCHNGNWYYTIY